MQYLLKPLALTTILDALLWNIVIPECGDKLRFTSRGIVGLENRTVEELSLADWELSFLRSCRCID